MAGFELRTSRVESVRSSNWATTTAQNYSGIVEHSLKEYLQNQKLFYFLLNCHLITLKIMPHLFSFEFLRSKGLGNFTVSFWGFIFVLFDTKSGIKLWNYHVFRDHNMTKATTQHKAKQVLLLLSLFVVSCYCCLEGIVDVVVSSVVGGNL